MARVGDRIEMASTKVGTPARSGVVRAVSGTLLTVRWTTGEETMLVPAAGTLSVIGRSGGAGRAVSSGKKAPGRTSGPKTATGTRAPAKKAAKKVAKKAKAKKTTATPRSKKAQPKKASSKKAPAKGGRRR